MSTETSVADRPRTRRRPKEQARPSRARETLARLGRAVCTTRAPYQAAVFRILLALAITAFLLREWPHRRVLYGDHSPLSYDMALELGRLDGSFSILHWSGGRLWFEIVYTLTVAAAVAVMVGWRTRTLPRISLPRSTPAT